jgi:hypothetical protein
MDIHKPKGAIRGWRELAKEIGIIVVGVLIALGAEQAVEALHWQHRVGEAEKAMAAELKQNMADGYYRLAVEPCLSAKLETVRQALAASHDTGAPVPILPPIRAPLRPWQSDEWDSARALQITDHMPTERLTAWSQSYFFATAERGTQTEEQRALIDLNTLSVNAGRLEPAERDRLFLALVGARKQLSLMSLGPTLMIQRAGALGLTLSPAEMRKVLAQAKDDFGGCAVAPDLSRPPG